MSFMTTLMMIKAIAAIVIVTVSAFVFVAILGGHLNRGVQTENIEFYLIKENVANVFTKDGITTLDTLEEFGDREDSKFAIKLDVGDKSFVSNQKIYDYKSLCEIDGTFVICGPTFKDFYLVDDKLELVKMDLVMLIE